MTGGRQFGSDLVVPAVPIAGTLHSFVESRILFGLFVCLFFSLEGLAFTFFLWCKLCKPASEGFSKFL